MSAVRDTLKRLNDALPLLVLTILCYGIAAELLGVWFVADQARYSSGLWIGIGCAVFMAVHIAVVIRDAVESGATDGHTRRQSAKSVLRYLVVAAVVLLTAYLNIGNPIAVFIGIFGLKIAAYLQPAIRKYLFKEGGDTH